MGYETKIITAGVKLVKAVSRYQKNKNSNNQLKIPDNRQNIYQGKGFAIFKSGNDYEISWQKGLTSESVYYPISKEHAERAMKSDKDANDVITYAETGKWPWQIKRENDAISECREFIQKHELRHANFLIDPLEPNQVVLRFSKDNAEVFATDDRASIVESGRKTFDDIKYAIENFKKRLVACNDIDDREKAKFVHPEDDKDCNPLICPACGLYLEINGSTPLRIQKHENILYETDACGKCGFSEGISQYVDLIYPLNTPAGTGSLADQRCHRYYMDFSSGNLPRILDVRKIGDDGVITDDCYVEPSEMMGSAMFIIKGHGTYACFVGNPLYGDLYRDFFNDHSGEGFYDRYCGYPLRSFSGDSSITDVLFLNKEVIDNTGYADNEVLWSSDVRFHYIDLWEV